MLKKNIFLPILALLCVVMVNAQNDPVLFSVEDRDVNLSEFKYIYEKTGGDQLKYDRASVEEYLERYVWFKLKVQRARELQMDTIPALINELEGYRKQLASNYLMDKELTNRLIEEAYNRSKYDLGLSHILIATEGNDTLKAYQKIKGLQKELKAGAEFATLAQKHSSDPNARTSGGNIGYMTVLQYPGLYNFESAAYNTAVGQVSDPVRTRYGYHLIRVNDKRPSRGRISVAQILVRSKGRQDGGKEKIQSYYQKILDGTPFEDVARQFSEDKTSSSSGGVLPSFGISEHEESFEAAAFELKNDGDVSKPFQSTIGYHILKRIEVKKVQDLKNARNRFLPKIKNDVRYSLAQDALIEKIKSDSKAQKNLSEYNSFINRSTKDLFAIKWQPKDSRPEAVLYTIGKQSYTVRDFETYLSKNLRDRHNANRLGSVKAGVDKLFNAFEKKTLLAYEEALLEDKYPDFKYLMREYREGILLFEVTKKYVWDEAGKDTTGLKTYFNDNRADYKWDDRAQISKVTVRTGKERLFKKIMKKAKRWDGAKLERKFNRTDQLIVRKSEVISKKNLEKFKGLNWKKGSLTSPVQQSDGSSTFVRLDGFIDERLKDLDECRGYVVADYQDHLEKEWIEELKRRYKVEVNQNVVNQFIR